MPDRSDQALDAILDSGSAVEFELESMITEIRRHRAIVAKFEAWASSLGSIGKTMGMRDVAAGIRNVLRGDA